MILHLHPKHTAHKFDKAEAELMLAMCAIVSGLVALPFVLVFDAVSDAILFCITVQAELDRRRASAVRADNDYPLPCVGYIDGFTNWASDWSPFKENAARDWSFGGEQPSDEASA